LPAARGVTAPSPMHQEEFIAEVSKRLQQAPAVSAIPEPELKEWTGYYFSLSGKHIRPQILWAVFNACEGRDWDRAVKVATAIEMVHNWTLVEDDWMDRDEQRRGAPALHMLAARASQGFKAAGDARHYGQVQATLVTNYLQSMASNEFAAAVSDLAETRDLIDYFESAVREVVRGQYLDFLIQDKLLAGDKVSRKQSLECNMAKTATLFRLAAFMGATLAEEDAAVWEELGGLLGLIFQQHNDLKDFNPEASKDNRKPFSDLREFKASSVNVLLADKIEPGEREVWQAFSRGDETKQEAMTAILSKHNILAECRESMVSLVKELEERVAKLPASSGKDLILENLNQLAL
jgi:geranylgeranyl diphosphate synthase type I